MLRVLMRSAAVWTCALGVLFVMAPPLSADAASSAFLRIVQASPDAPALDVYVDGQKSVAGLAFEKTTGYVAIPAGAHIVAMAPVGSSVANGAPSTANVEMLGGHAYTVVAVDVNAKIAPLVLEDSVSMPPSGKSAIRLVYCSPDAPSVADIAISNGPVIIRNLNYKTASAYVDVDPGTVRLDVRPAGSPLPLATTSALQVQAGRAYSIFAVGLLANHTFNALSLPDNAVSGGLEVVPSTGGGGTASHSAKLPFGPAAVLLGIAGVAGLWKASGIGVPTEWVRESRTDAIFDRVLETQREIVQMHRELSTRLSTIERRLASDGAESPPRSQTLLERLAEADSSTLRAQRSEKPVREPASRLLRRFALGSQSTRRTS